MENKVMPGLAELFPDAGNSLQLSDDRFLGTALKFWALALPGLVSGGLDTAALVTESPPACRCGSHMGHSFRRNFLTLQDRLR